MIKNGLKYEFLKFILRLLFVVYRLVQPVGGNTMEKIVKVLIMSLILTGASGMTGIGIMLMNNSALNTNNKTLDNKYNDLIKLYDSQINSYVVLNSTYRHVLSEYQNMLQELDNSTESYEQLNLIYSQLLSNYSILSNDYNYLKGTYNSLVNDYNTLKNNYTALQNSYLGLWNKYLNLNTTYWSLYENYQNLQIVYNSQHEEYIQLNQTYWNLYNSDQILQGNYSTLNDEYIQLNQTYWGLYNDNQILQSNYTSLNSQYSDLLINYNQLLSARDQLLQDYNSLLSNYNQLQSDYNNLQSNYSSLQNDYSTLQSNYNQLQIEKNQLQANYDDLYNQYITLNSTYWELWNSTQPNYQIEVVSYYSQYTHFYLGGSTDVTINLQYLDSSPVINGTVVANGYLCHYIGGGNWIFSISSDVVYSITLNNVVYVDTSGNILDVDQNNQALSLFWYDHLTSTLEGQTVEFYRDPVHTVFKMFNGYGGYVSIDFWCNHGWYFSGENGNFQFTVINQSLPTNVYLFDVNGTPVYSSTTRYVFNSSKVAMQYYEKRPYLTPPWRWVDISGWTISINTQGNIVSDGYNKTGSMSSSMMSLGNACKRFVLSTTMTLQAYYNGTWYNITTFSSSSSANVKFYAVHSTEW